MPLSPYPEALTSFPAIGPNTREDDPATAHDEVHERVHESLRALESAVGTDDGAGGLTGLRASVADHDARIAELEMAGPGAAIGRTLTAVFDGGSVDGVGQSVPVGSAVQVRAPYALTLTGWTLIQQGGTGDVVVDVRTKPFATGSFASITDSAAPASSSGANAEGGVSGWTASVSAGDLVEFVISSRTGLVPRVTLQLQATQA